MTGIGEIVTAAAGLRIDALTEFTDAGRPHGRPGEPMLRGTEPSCVPRGREVVEQRAQRVRDLPAKLLVEDHAVVAER